MLKFIPFIFIFFSFLPLVSNANLEITEIMYDVEGSDTGTEWIEIYNSGSQAIDIASWHFYENETHHGLVPDGFSILAPSSYALIVQDIAIIRSLYGNSIKLIKSSFSLNNTGETLALSDENKSIQGNVSYSTDDGAAGNGMTLQWNGNEWIQAEPTPGAVNQSEGEENENESDEEDEDEDSSSSTKKKQIPSPDLQEEGVDYYEGFIIFGEQRFVDSPVEIEVYVEHTKNKKKTKLKRGTFFINFGDGVSFESEERFITNHIYAYPGNYEVSFEFYRNPVPFPEDKPDVFIRQTLNIKTNKLELEVEEGGGITLTNKTGGDINIDGWKIKTLNQSYLFPSYSYLKKDGSITLSSETHTFSYINKYSVIDLFNTQGEIVFSYPKDVVRETISASTNNSNTLTSKITSELSETGIPATTHLEEFLNEYPDKHEVSFDSYGELFNEEEVQKEPSSSSIPLWLLFTVGGMALLLGFFKITMTNKKETPKAENESFASIELIE